MTEEEFSDLMRKAMRDPRLFEELTVTAEGEDEAYNWLITARKKVNDDLGRRRMDRSILGNQYQSGSVPHRDYTKILAEDAAWRKRALGFQAVLDRHIDMLKTRGRNRNVSRNNDERDLFRRSLLRLAQAILAHQAERITDGELYGLLDDIKMPHGLDGERSLRDVVNSRVMIA